MSQQKLNTKIDRDKYLPSIKSLYLWVSTNFQKTAMLSFGLYKLLWIKVSLITEVNVFKKIHFYTFFLFY